MRCGFFLHKALYCFFFLTGRAWGSPSNFPQLTLVCSSPDLCGLPKVSATADQSRAHHPARVTGREEILHPPEKDLGPPDTRGRGMCPPPPSLQPFFARLLGGGEQKGSLQETWVLAAVQLRKLSCPHLGFLIWNMRKCFSNNFQNPLLYKWHKSIMLQNEHSVNI